ncbi:MAG: hypothetical protein O3C28_14410 [Proteobacteria bacterium]|nr:hypothetical protein [Pseudomonadota bacterium]
MPDEHLHNRRFSIVLALGAVGLVAWIFLSDPTVDLVSETFVVGKVVEVIGEEVEEKSASASKKALSIIVVELPEGGQARVVTIPSKAQVGGALRLKVKNYDDGTRRVVAAPLTVSSPPADDPP